MELKKGYKYTEVGVIPEDWEVKELKEICTPSKKRINPITSDRNFKCIELEHLSQGSGILLGHANSEDLKSQKSIFETGDVLFGKLRPYLRKFLLAKFDGVCTTEIWVLKAEESVFNVFLYQLVQSERFTEAANLSTGTKMPRAEWKIVSETKIPVPPSKAEQTAIATALSDMDNLIAGLEKLIEKKKAIKQGAMQELLRPKEGWVVKRLEDVTDVLDNLRVPLNDTQRSRMKGDIPYCGANGIVDYVNDFVIDDDIILMAEDGGYFDEYKTRPIAYRMIGKCWVNNHAHILKAKSEYDQGIVFFSLVHKNILDFISGGTRAKLNKGELLNIEISIPKDKKVQSQIALVLSDMENEIKLMEDNFDKFKMIKQGMMQELLTGKTRLV